MRDPAAEFSGPYPNRRRPSQLDQLGVPVPAPDRHGGDAKLFLHGLDEGGVGGRGAAPFLERGTTPINRISTFCCPCGGAPVATPLNMKPAPRLGQAGGAESQGVRSPGGGDGGGRANAATLLLPARGDEMVGRPSRIVTLSAGYLQPAGVGLVPGGHGAPALVKPSPPPPSPHPGPTPAFVRPASPPPPRAAPPPPLPASVG
jgi:hypothetical protein